MTEKKQCDCHRQIKTSSLFADIRGCEVEDDLARRKLNACMAESCSDTFFGFFDGCIGQADDLDRRERFITIDFDTHFIAGQSEGGECFDFVDGHGSEEMVKGR